MRQSVGLGHGSKNAVKRVVIRPSIEIVQDLDCLLYLQSGLQECETLSPYDTADPDSRPIPQINRIMAQDTFVNGYIYPSSKEILLQNLARLQETKSACMGRVSEALKAVQHEADIAIEHLSAKGRVCEANVLTSMLVESPESYGTMAVYERNRQFEASQRLEAMRLSQKRCGRLFLVIKSSTLPLCLNPCPVECISIDDIQSAEGYLERLIERLKLLPLGPHGTWSTIKSIRYGTEYSLSSRERGLDKYPLLKTSRSQYASATFLARPASILLSRTIFK
ncbi:hypothetical protein AOL_s00043g151 [Orbilia oligospora ATCC 24927]|uniref:Uncharacterized protein n=1 Tax=Arthrobotrys oligospora (strain ATCC 24927 / CBS 115.81 / DSM 1491) TaxID=756982 RepID=G1X378_ARTOA|nr:hypothetical protein AOL_s00043g151 [Orbilia oligospora ATCC 24927]EGX52362.1 hypothetical protein AOL_s00043g151 [Orbilia oligospora ATCC 24927]